MEFPAGKRPRIHYLIHTASQRAVHRAISATIFNLGRGRVLVSILLFSGELPDNSDRAEWAKNALAVFCDETGLDLEFENQEAVGDLMTNLGHYCDRYGLDFLSIVSGAVG